MSDGDTIYRYFKQSPAFLEGNFEFQIFIERNKVVCCEK